MVSVFSTALYTGIDLESSGKRVGRLHLPHSVTRSAYGVVPVPIAVVANGDGPTVLLMAGNHGDEYEGQIALGKLIRALRPEDVAGRIVVLPSANLPACRAGTRTSPLDGANLNRIFPADPAHGPTHALAHYLEHGLMAMADIVVDLHSGGGSLDYLPFVAATLTGDRQRDRRAVALMRAFGGPYGHLWPDDGSSATATGAAVRQGCIAIGGEFGGAGMVTPQRLAAVERGLANLLAAAGALPGRAVAKATEPMRPMHCEGEALYAFAPDYGVFVPAVSLGCEVAAGDPAGEVHSLEHPERAPQSVRFRAAGLVCCLRAMGRVEPGDCLAHLAVDAAWPEL